jgi:hypothetical protein
MPAVYFGRPCQMFYNPTERSWAISQGCDWRIYAYPTPGANPSAAASGGYDSYWSGVDGVDAPASTATNLLNLANACYFSEGVPSTTPKTLQADAVGFYLFAATPTWAADGFPTGNWEPSNSARACELIIRN